MRYRGVPSTSGRAAWREIFGNTSKEDTHKQRVVPGGSFGRSVLSSDASVKRLLQAMRSMAPGGWSDDRWEQTRHFVGIAYVAIHNICKQLAQAEFQVFEKDSKHPDGKKPITESTPPHGDRTVRPYDLVDLLHKPNKQDSFGKWMYRVGQQKYLTGKALTWMVPNKLRTPMELYCIPTAIAIPQPTINPDYPDGYYRIQPVYPYGPFSSYPTPSTAVGAPISAEWVIEFKYPHPLLRYDGYSPLTGMRLHLDEVEMMDRARHYSMRRTVNPSAVLNFDDLEGMEPLPEAEVERIKAEFEDQFEGPENSGKLYVATPGARLEKWETSLKEMEFQGGWEQLVSFCMGGFGITRPAAGMIEDGSYATLFATLKQLHLTTLEPETNDIASDLTRFLAPFFGDDLIVEIRCKRIDDHDLRNAIINVAMNARAITKNEVRKLLDLPVSQEPWGGEMAGTEPQPVQDPNAGPAPGAKMDPAMSETAMRAILGGNNQGITNAGGMVPDEMGTEPPIVASGRPRPDGLGTGALGPRKGMNYYKKNLRTLRRKYAINDSW